MPASSHLARAKINLALSVGPPIPAGAPKAGYHPIASWMACIDLADELSFTRLEDGRASTFSITLAPDAPRPSPIDWPIETDLAVRAHRLLERTAGRPLPVACSIRKRIPVGGGLGGGSSDAATTLLALRDLFGLDFSSRDLASLSAQLGSDVAFFIDEHDPARPALVSGLGDRLERFPVYHSPVLLIIPPMGCPTGPVYKSYDRSPVALREADVLRLITGASKLSPALDPCDLFNDLAGPACQIEPRLSAVIARLRELTPLPVHVTGSGSTLFVLPSAPSNAASLLEVMAAVRRDMPDLLPLMTRLV